MLKNINNIIFDLGEVIIDLDFKRTEKALASLLGQSSLSLYTHEKQTGLFNKLETGHISPKEFRNELKKMSSNPITDAEIDAAWNAMLVCVPSKKIALARQLREKMNTFVLSNTNKIHIDYVNAYLLPKHQIASLKDIFDYVYYSHEIGYRKPDPMAYQYILDIHHIAPTETLFIDDKIENIMAAKHLGIKTWHLTNRNDLYQLNA